MAGISRLRRRIHRNLPTAGYLLGTPTAVYGVATSFDGHLGRGLLLVAAGILLCLPRRIQVRASERERRKHLLLLSLRVHPDQTAAQIGAELGWKPGRLYPLLDRLVEAGDVTRQKADGRWTYRHFTPQYDPNWAEKRPT
jgi:hypothetical protein